MPVGGGPVYYPVQRPYYVDGPRYFGPSRPPVVTNWPTYRRGVVNNNASRMNANVGPSNNNNANGSPQYVFVIFQQNASNDDKDWFVKNYNVSVADGPNPDGYYKLQLASPLSQEVFGQMMDSMRSQNNIVSEVTN